MRLPRFIGHPNGKEMKTEMDQQTVGAEQRSAKQGPPNFISHLTGIVLRVLKRKQLMIQMDQ